MGTVNDNANVKNALHAYCCLTPSEKREFTQQIIPYLTSDQTSILMAAFYYDFLEKLPILAAHHILLYLDDTSLENAFYVSPKWASVIKSFYKLWRLRFKRLGVLPYVSENNEYFDPSLYFEIKSAFTQLSELPRFGISISENLDVHCECTFEQRKLLNAGCSVFHWCQQQSSLVWETLKFRSPIFLPPNNLLGIANEHLNNVYYVDLSTKAALREPVAQCRFVAGGYGLITLAVNLTLNILIGVDWEGKLFVWKLNLAVDSVNFPAAVCQVFPECPETVSILLSSCDSLWAFVTSPWTLKLVKISLVASDVVFDVVPFYRGTLRGSVVLENGFVFCVSESDSTDSLCKVRYDEMTSSWSVIERFSLESNMSNLSLSAAGEVFYLIVGICRGVIAVDIYTYDDGLLWRISLFNCAFFTPKIYFFISEADWLNGLQDVSQVYRSKFVMAIKSSSPDSENRGAYTYVLLDWSSAKAL